MLFRSAAVDSSNRPVAVPQAQGSYNALAAGTGAPNLGNSGYTIMGLPVVTDATVTTTNGSGSNEDVILVGSFNELHLWEEGDGSPRMLRFEQPKAAELDITMIVYGYVAYSANRYPNAWAKITGTGLTTPSF